MVNPLGSQDPQDFKTNVGNLDKAVNQTSSDKWNDRFGDERFTWRGLENKVDAALARIAFNVPVDYTPGLLVNSNGFTVEYAGVVYAPQPSNVPFTAGAWNASQWYPIQNVFTQNNLLIFDDYTSAQAAAATLPDGQLINAPNINGRLTQYKVSGGSLVFDRSVEPADGEYRLDLPDALQRTIKDRLSDAVSILDFVSLTMSQSDMTAGLQKALDCGASRIYGADGIFEINDSLVISNSRTHLILPAGCHIKLNASDDSKTPIKITGAESSVTGGKVTSTRRGTQWVIELIGDGSFAKRVDVTHATKSISPVVLYNRGGIACKGKRSAAIYCDVSNMEGMGIVTYEDSCRVYQNKVHDNITGVHMSDYLTANFGTQVVQNMIYSNNVNHDSGAVGILGSIYSHGALIADNVIIGNGEHGTYLYNNNSIIRGNYCTGNYRNGLKVRNCRDTMVVNNICRDNNLMGESQSGEIVLQVHDADVSDVVIDGNIARHTAGNGGIVIAYITASNLCASVRVSNNKADFMQLPFSSKLSVIANDVAGVLTVGAAITTAPLDQFEAIVDQNVCDSLQLGRCVQSRISRNSCRTMGGMTRPGKNKFYSNKITGQAEAIDRGWLSEFCDNDVNAAPLGSTNLFKQAANPSDNQAKTLDGNRFTGVGARLINDSSSSASGSNYRFTNNMSDGAFEMVSMWGEGHIIMGNQNTSGTAVGFVGCNNSYMVANLPKVNERAGTSGNVNV